MEVVLWKEEDMGHLKEEEIMEEVLVEVSKGRPTMEVMVVKPRSSMDMVHPMAPQMGITNSRRVSFFMTQLVV